MSDNEAVYGPDNRSGTQPIGPAEEFAEKVERVVRESEDDDHGDGEPDEEELDDGD